MSRHDRLDSLEADLAELRAQLAELQSVPAIAGHFAEVETRKLIAKQAAVRAATKEKIEAKYWAQHPPVKCLEITAVRNAPNVITTNPPRGPKSFRYESGEPRSFVMSRDGRATMRKVDFDSRMSFDVEFCQLVAEGVLVLRQLSDEENLTVAKRQRSEGEIHNSGSNPIEVDQSFV